MRLIYLSILLFAGCQILYGQQLVPLSQNYLLNKINATRPAANIDLRSPDNNCVNILLDGATYLLPGQAFNTFVQIDTMGLDTLPGEYSCLNCDQLSFGTTTLVEDSLTYTANPNVEGGKDVFTIEFCNPNGCNTATFTMIVRRSGQSIAGETVIVNPDSTQQIEVLTNSLPGPLLCYQTVECEDEYNGEPRTVALTEEGVPASVFLNYTAGATEGIDSICVMVCDSFAVCDTIRFALQVEFAARAALTLPFLDDFSYEGPFPDNGNWLDNNVFINNTMATNPVSVGVATFDGLNAQGLPYGNDYGVSDFLTSAFIDLSPTQTEEIFLTYWLQRRGLVDKPEPQDSIILEFKAQTGEWITIEAIPGVPISQPNTVEEPFIFYSIPITNEFKYSDFQFRFKNYSNRTGILDTWHLDYVKLDRNASSADSLFNDIAFTATPKSILKNHSSMPWQHFKNSGFKDLRETVEVGIYNADFQPRVLTGNQGRSDISLLEQNFNIEMFNIDGALPTLLNDQEANIPNGVPYSRTFFLEGPVTVDGEDVRFPVVLPTYLNNLQRAEFDQAETLAFRMRYTFSTNQQGGLPAVVRNDTVRHTTVFDNYFAYDDGTAEAGFVARQGTTIAIEFEASVDDSLRAVQFHFPHTSIDVSDQTFDLKVWLDSLNTEPVYVQFDVRPFYTALFFDTLQGFSTYQIIDESGRSEPLAIPAGKFYIGWEQITPCDGLQCIPIGFDRNNTNGKQFISISEGGSFGPLNPFLPEGALMIRPIVGSTTPDPTVSTETPVMVKDPVRVYPNPAQDFIQFEIKSDHFTPARYEILNALGQLLQRGPLSTSEIETGVLQNGWYHLRLLDERSGQAAVSSFVIAR